MDQTDDYRELQRKKWEQSQTAKTQATNQAASSSSAVPAPVSPPNQSTPEDSSLCRLHLLPLTTIDGTCGPANDLNFLAPRLRQLRNDGVEIVFGSVFEVEGWEYVAVGVEPVAGGSIGQATEFFLDGDAVGRFQKVQFLALSELSSSTLFSDYIRIRFNPDALEDATPKPSGLRTLEVMQINQNIEINDVTFCVAATDPVGFGIIDPQSLIYVEPDSTAEFEKIHVVPFHDTLPRAYQFDIFTDYVKPFFKQSPLTKFSAQEHFTYQGVQFKVVCCEPSGPRRVGKSTTIYCEGVLHPSLRNLLPQELLVQLSYLPPGLQMLLLNTDAIGSGEVYERLMDVQEMLTARQGMSAETIDQIESIKWAHGEENAQQQCMVCLSDFEVDESVRKLPCSHVFHGDCIDEWLRRCTDCPICKTNIDRSLRNY